jgi:hypothetical protein
MMGFPSITKMFPSIKNAASTAAEMFDNMDMDIDEE